MTRNYFAVGWGKERVVVFFDDTDRSDVDRAWGDALYIAHRLGARVSVCYRVQMHRGEWDEVPVMCDRSPNVEEAA